MKYAELANAGVLEQPVYEPGKPIETVAREYGLDPAAIAKLASNENPLDRRPRRLPLPSPVIEQSPVSGLRLYRAAHRACRGTGAGGG